MTRSRVRTVLEGALYTTALGVTAAAFIPSAYLALLAVVAQRRLPRASESEPTCPARFVVCVPAHNEAAVIGHTVAALREQDFDGAAEIHVVADNCSDETAAIARQAGAEVHERTDLTDPGKGAALNWFADRVALRPHDVVVIIDADTIAEPGFLAAMNCAFAAGIQVAQGHYGVKDPETSPAVALRYAAIVCRHHLRPLARTRLGASSGLYGNGMAFRWDLLRDRRWTNHLVEDAEFQMDLLFDGHLVTYVPDAVVRAEMPASLSAAASQNERWELGRMQLVRRFVPRLVRHVFVGGRAPRRAYLDATLDHLTPPLAFQAMVDVLAAGAGVSLLLLRRNRTSGVFAVAGLSSCVMVSAHVLTGLRISGAPRSVYRSLLAAPRVILWKLFLLARIVRRPGDVAWTRTERNSIDIVP